jgi:hypothetical protein
MKGRETNVFENMKNKFKFKQRNSKLFKNVDQISLQDRMFNI